MKDPSAHYGVADASSFGRNATFTCMCREAGETELAIRIPTIERGRKGDTRGMDAPMPISGVLKAKANDPKSYDIRNPRSYTHYFTKNEISKAVGNIRRGAGSRLVAKFPNLVQAAAPT